MVDIASFHENNQTINFENCCSEVKRAFLKSTAKRSNAQPENMRIALAVQWQLRNQKQMHYHDFLKAHFRELLILFFHN